MKKLPSEKKRKRTKVMSETTQTIDPTSITLTRLPDGRWKAIGPAGREREYRGSAARDLDVMFGRPEGK
jgi:hypothetical protein